MQTRRLTLRKTERLYEKKAIDNLFEDSKQVNMPPLRLLWKMEEKTGASETRAAFSVPKRNFKRAVDRNLLKRRMREAHRKHKSLLNDVIKGNKQCNMMYIYMSRSIASYEEIESKLVLTLQRVIKELDVK
ncbi:MAG TPA: ribonuclease P protein component [Bacteroidia bacterium]|jgi:ribonuclease P protein component|nr:ribonuclease P protein component [Bacteroidia bacterium]